SGSDAASLKTSARRVGGDYVLNGTKVFITNIGRAGVYIVFARTGPDERASGVSAFIVPADSNGLRVGQVFKKMGLNGSPTGELESARLRAYRAAWLCASHRPFTRIASMAKLHCTDTAMDVALGALQLAGEEGAIAGSPFERHMRDAKALQIYEGSNQVQRVVISRDLVNAR